MIFSMKRSLARLTFRLPLLLMLTGPLPIQAQEPGEILEPVLQEIRPGYQTVVGQKYTCINRGDFIDVYDNRSRALFRSIPVSVDQGAEKGKAFTFMLSRDERLLQTKAWIKYIGERTATFDLASGREVRNVRISGRDAKGSMNDFNDPPSHLPAKLEPDTIARFTRAPSFFQGPDTFVLTERLGDNPPRFARLNLLRGDRDTPGFVDTLGRFQKAASSRVGFRSNPKAAILSFSVKQLQEVATQKPIGGSKGLPSSPGETSRVLAIVDKHGSPRFVTSSVYEEGRHRVRDLVLRQDRRACALAWDVYPGKPSELYGVEVRLMENGGMIFRDPMLFAECLSFGRNPEDLYVVGRFGHRQGPLSGIGGLVLAKLRLTARGAEPVWHTPVPSMVEISVDPQGQRVYAVSTDGRLHLFQAKTGTKLIDVTGYEKHGLLLRTPGHFFLATEEAENALALRSGERAYPLEQFDLHFNRPHTVLKTLGAPEALIKQATLAYQDRLTLHGLSDTHFRDVGDLPEIEAVVKTTADRKLTLQVKAWAKAGELRSVSAWVNHVPILGKSGTPLQGKSVSGDVTVPLVEGRNKIQVSVMDSQGQESVKETIWRTSTQEVPSKTARLLAIGVSDYLAENADLNYAAKDARDLVAALSSSLADRYQIRTKLLVNGTATKENILAAREFFRAGQPDDLAVVFLAGHGALSPKSGRYYFCPHDMDFRQPAKKGLTYAEIESLLFGIPAMRRLIMIDSCHSGELTRSELRAAAAAAKTAVAGTGRKVPSLRPIGVRADENKAVKGSSMPTIGYGFQDRRRQIGAQVLSAAGPLEVALEGPGWKNGVFTHHVITGLEDQKADQNGDGALTVGELFESVAEKVHQLTNGTQRPRFRHANRGFDFPLVGSFGKPLPPLRPKPAAKPAPLPKLPKLPAVRPGRRFPNLSRALITREKAGAMSYAQLRYAINELYAIHGFPFESARSAPIRKHFSQFPWFQPEAGLEMAAVDHRMSAIEKENIKTLAEARKAKR